MTAVLMALLAVAVQPAPTPPVYLAPVQCTELLDATVRAPLHVELGNRLLDEDAALGPDILFISIACQGSDATLVAGRRRDGERVVRRVVHLGDVAPEARPRELALAAVELVHLADLRNAAPPTVVSPTTVAPPPTVNRTPVPSPRPPRSWTLTITGTLSFGGGYLSNGYLPTEGVSAALGVEHGPERSASSSWQWALAAEFTALGGRYQSANTGGFTALLQRRSGFLVPELGVGARAGYISGVPKGDTTTNVVAGGPVASVGLDLRFLPAISWEIGLQGGYDLHGPGAWILPRLGYTFRF